MFGSFSQQSRITDDIFFLFQRSFQCFGIYYFSSRRIDNEGCFFKGIEKVGVGQMICRVFSFMCQRSVKCDDVGFPTNFFERNKIGFAFGFLPGGDR